MTYETTQFNKLIGEHRRIIEKYDEEITEKVRPILKKCKQKELNKNRVRCYSETSNGYPCSRWSLVNEKYCGIHINNKYNNETEINNQTNYADFEIQIEDDYINDKTESTDSILLNDGKTNVDMRIEFIEDSFYYVDEKYVYSKNDFKKIGIKTDDEYVLFDNPIVE
jgi:hypothetical protein